MVSKIVKISAILSLFVAQGVFTPPVEAAKKGKCTTKTFQYKDKEGVTVTNSTLPPEYSQNGYEIICATTGLLIEKVAPRKTDEQLRQEALEAEQKAKEARIRREQDRLDAILINSYTDMSDIERARDNELRAQDQTKMLLQNNINRSTRMLEDTQTRAARDERLGKELSPALMKEINQFKRRIAKEKKKVEEVEEEKVMITDRYNSSIIRFSELKAAERLRQFRDNQDQSKDNNHSIYECRGEKACDNAWTASLRFASEHSTTELAWANQSTIMMRKPNKDKDLSLVITRVDNSRGDSASLVLEIRCAKTQKGEAFCASKDVTDIKDGFAAYLQAGPTNRP